MWRFLVRLFAVIGVLAVLLVGSMALFGWWAMRTFAPPALPQRIVLDLDLRGSLPETSLRPGFVAWGLAPELTVSDVVLGLEQAARDPRVAGVVALLDDTAHGLAVAQELRAAIGHLRRSGRFAVATAETFGEMSSGNEGYYLATAFEEIDLQPVGLVGLTGLMAHVPYVRPLLDSLGIEVEVGKRAAYKTAFESLVEPTMTPANREMIGGLLDGLMAQLVEGIAQGRGVPENEARALVDAGPFTGPEAVSRRLVDRLRYPDETRAEAVRRAGQDAMLVPIEDYVSVFDPGPATAAPTVAFIRAVGQIHRGSGPLGASIGADDLVEALEQALEDDEVRAVLLRVDSPGGSAVASESIGRGIRRLIEAGKPVVVSMGNTAASGGYWIAMDASRIVAAPASLTGSIGVIAGKPNLAGAWDKLGVDWVALPRGRNAEIWSFNQPYTPQGRARLEAVLDQLYGDFKRGVAQGRDLAPAEVEGLAQGRVWLGAKAKELGLVDELGGLIEAAAAVRDTLELPADGPLRLEPFPRPESPIEELVTWLTAEMGASSGLAQLARTIGYWLVPGSASAPVITIR